MRRLEFDGDGVRLIGDAAGSASARPVLFLHGGSQTRQSWGLAVERTAEAGYLAVTLDLRGHGESGWALDGDYRLDRFVADIRSVCRHFSQPPFLVGASLGGLTALLTAGETDQALAGIVLVDIAPRIEEEGAAAIRAFLRAYPEGFASVEAAADAVSRYLPHRPRPKNVNGLLKNLRLKGDGRYYWHWDPRSVDGPTSSNPFGYVDRLTAAAKNLHVPALLIRGALSDVLSEEGAKEFLTLAPKAEYTDIIGAGHMIAGDKNDAFNSAILSFLRSH